MAKIFICYRREDSGPAAGRIYDRLEHHFGRGQVFMDVDDVPLGVDYRGYLDRQIRDCNLVLAVIGRKWLTARDGRRGRRLDAPRDFVRTEIEIALERDIPLIPILLETVTMPGEDSLPSSIRPLAFRNAATVHAAGSQFRGHMERLIHGIERLLDHAEQELQAQPPAAPQPRSPDEAQRNPGKPRTSSPKTPPPTRPSPARRGPDAAQRNPGPAQPAKAEPPPNPEAQTLLAEIADPATNPKRRLAIGDRLAELGDPRPGVGLGPDGLPDIDWVEIPAGDFLYGAGKERRHTDGFRIARYPITNAQYQAFVAAADGYADDRWWQGLSSPDRSPQPARWPVANHPRETVSWYEAMAFCAWFSDRLGCQSVCQRSTSGSERPAGPTGASTPGATATGPAMPTSIRTSNGTRSGRATLDRPPRRGFTRRAPPPRGRWTWPAMSGCGA